MPSARVLQNPDLNKMMKLCILIAVVASHRVSELERLDAGDESSDSKPKGINLLLVPGPEFAAMERPVLSHQMEIKPGAPDMNIDIQETGSGLKANGYEVELVGPNGKLQVGKLKSKAPGLFSTKTKYEFQTTSGRSLLRMYIPNWGQMAGRRSAYVTNDVKKNPHTYYTFSKDGTNYRYGTGGMEVVFSVFKGRTTMGFDTPPTPYLQAKGHYKGWKFEFFLAGQAEPVAVMAMTDNKFSGLQIKQRYRLKIKSGVDPIMLSMLVGFIDSCNNYR